MTKEDFIHKAAITIFPELLRHYESGIDRKEYGYSENYMMELCLNAHRHANMLWDAQHVIRNKIV